MKMGDAHTGVESAFKPQGIVTKQANITVEDDGCGVVNDRNASSWIALTESEIENVKEIQQCLNRTTGGWPGSQDYADINPRAFQGKLKFLYPLNRFDQHCPSIMLYGCMVILSWRKHFTRLAV
jgi:hypothetical protein